MLLCVRTQQVVLEVGRASSETDLLEPRRGFWSQEQRQQGRENINEAFVLRNDQFPYPQGMNSSQICI